MGAEGSMGCENSRACPGCDSHENAETAQLKRMGSVSARDGAGPGNERGPLGGKLLPAVKKFFRDAYMKRFMTNMYTTELARADGKCWSHVAHACRSKPELNAMNVAMPDLSCEYWCTFVPKGERPIVELKFPEWAMYTSLTIYDNEAMPFASVNILEAAAGTSEKVTQLEDGRCRVDMMKGETYDDLTRLIFRIYRPDNV